MSRRALRVLVLLGLGLVGLLLQASVAGAVWRGRPPQTPPAVRSDTNTQLVLSSTGPGQAVSGFIANPANPFDPVTDGYPASDPSAGWSAKDESFAGVIFAQPPGSGENIKLYCIDIDTDTWIGIGYALGTWDAASVPNVGWVARLLHEYYPSTDEPAGLTDLDEKAAAVQAAIWFFSDRYVLSTSSPLHNAVAEIVDHIIKAGPLRQPPAPSLTLSPSHLSGPPGGLLGPFTLTTDQDSATVTATGGSMFSNPDGTGAIPDGTPVPSGQKIWVRSTGPSLAVLQATAVATVPTGSVYLYDGNAGDGDRQKLILSHTATLRTIVQATAEFLRPGSLVVKKTIGGPAAGLQGPVVIDVACDVGGSLPPFKIPARASRGTRSHTYEGIPTGAHCTVIEIVNGSVAGTVGVVVHGDGQQVTIPADQSTTVHITDVYHQFGSLLIRKTIAGPAAGQQGNITVHTVCNRTALTDWVIAPGSRPGDQSRQYDAIPVPARCTVTETADGHTGAVGVVVVPGSQTVSIHAGEIAQADILDTYGLVPGQLEVTKTIAGTAAGLQGTVVIHTACDGTPLTPDLVIPAGTPAGDQSQIYSGIPTPASCVATETVDGHTSTVPVAVTGSPASTSIPPGGAGAAHIADIYGPAPGSLLVTKTIAGPLAGQQGPIIIHVVCNGTALSPDFVIGAGSAADSVSHSFDGIPAGSTCTVTETADGGTTTVAALVSGSGQTVTVPAGKVVPVSLVDVYGQPLGGVEEDVAPPLGGSGPFQPIRGYLKVIKKMTGAAARQHGRIEILVDCGPAHAFAFLIPAHTSGSVSRVFPGLPARSRCTVTETENGHTNAVRVLTTSKSKHARVPTKGGASVRLTDIFSPIVVAPAGLG